MNKLVSVILTTHNRKPKMVKRAIESVLNQTHKNLELIIVDDSLSDFIYRNDVARMILSMNDKRIKYIQNKENKGSCISRNIGIRISKGNYIMYLDDDDELLPNKIKYSLDKFGSDENIGLVYSQNYVIDQDSNKRYVRNKMISGYVFDELIKENFVSAFPLFRRECIEECGMFDPNMESMQDYELWLRIAQKYKLQYVAKPLVNVYLHNGKRISTNNKKKVQGAKEIYKRYEAYLDTHRSAKNARLLSLVINYARNNEFKKARRTMVQAIKTAPYRLYDNIKYTYLLYKLMMKSRIRE